MDFFLQKKFSAWNHLFINGRGQPSWCSGNALDLYFGVAQSEFWLPYWLSELKFFNQFTQSLEVCGIILPELGQDHYQILFSLSLTNQP
jgi:hypothetical protein